MNRRGFSLLSSIIIVLVLASLAAYMVRLSGLMQMNTTLSVQSARAHYAAISALAWVKANVQQQAGSLCNGSGVNCCTRLLGPQLPIESFTIVVDRCRVQSQNETGIPYDAFNVTVSASRGRFGQSGFVSKQLRGVFFNPPQ